MDSLKNSAQNFTAFPFTRAPKTRYCLRCLSCVTGVTAEQCLELLVGIDEAFGEQPIRTRIHSDHLRPHVSTRLHAFPNRVDEYLEFATQAFEKRSSFRAGGAWRRNLNPLDEALQLKCFEKLFLQCKQWAFGRLLGSPFIFVKWVR